MGLMSVQMAQGETASSTQVLQLDRGSAALVNNQRQFAAISTQCGFLLLLREQRSRSPLGPAAATACEQADQQEQRREAGQSSKRELLSRGRELRGGVRPESWGRVLGVDSWPGGRRLGL